ncbi:MAG: flagellar protein export ATPase FliI [Piscirickettsiaceae bacterium CG_4_9_14_3_um_filter_43_564]|nr:flagellar protein export ATPase FliI [Thiomicrospira sp.]OIP96128.1 MAG: flagellar protein export ATPase FliI [Thiomicrospira sp. CG2_30_44_34]PIQ02664.1 MAG: flagellar protein export ATPase FliI [Piscirickettsiaceae bacterium CG18_big_fil_WC_8_21_14_2_50_44_103]PIU38549.1 MAG: flagellar protein export ATPase FliI [Piscirickettsiaceae bacterium CG07_land_8_20_14_0_80_44_28]PIW57650.1 MAG: flagellar protein export ATPase FliI [Piscirickettsiaceae bacterium CG12_big_fil_rev_8_21_14_0_65_44_934
MKPLLNQFLNHRISALFNRMPENTPLAVEGRLVRMVGMTLEVVGTYAPIGSRCQIYATGQVPVEAEVVGFSNDRLYLMPIGHIHGLEPNARVVPLAGGIKIGVSRSLLGRVIDGAGNPLDDKGSIAYEKRVSLTGQKINPLHRAPIREPLDVGIKTINGLLTLGKGQRIGLLAGTGVGKSVLLGMMTRFTDAEVVVVGLVGERGREVNDFVRNNLGEEGLKRAVVVATPADDPPLMRLHGAMLATSIAEYFRDQGKDVLLLMDSLTRFAQAQREIALAVGEPPASKGYPPSVFAKLPQLVERAGNGAEHSGSITAIYTVLAEGDDENDPVVDSARGVLDGHILLSRQIADSGRYPAIDIESSISRVMIDIVPTEQIHLARRFKQLYSIYQQNQDLISIGAYRRGSDPAIDEAIDKQPQLANFLMQSMAESYSVEQSLEGLKTALEAV